MTVNQILILPENTDCGNQETKLITKCSFLISQVIRIYVPRACDVHVTVCERLEMFETCVKGKL